MGPAGDRSTSNEDLGTSVEDRATSDEDRDVPEPDAVPSNEHRTTTDGDQTPTDEGSVPASDDEVPAEAGTPTGRGRRSVEVPPELFRIVVVFSTLIAVASVILGFAALDAATRVVENPTGSLIVGLVRAVTGLSAAGVEPYLTPVALAVGVLGLALVGAGVWVYAVGTRFRTAGMETPNTDGDEAGDDG